jgi:competence ComEA-like helix-hairpin-helix protein
VSDPEGLAFRDAEEKKARFSRDVAVMGALLLMVAGLLFGRGYWMPSVAPPHQAQVQVKGAVPHPGWYSLSVLDVHHALEAAGVNPGAVENAPIAEGWTLEVGEQGQLRLEPSADMLVFGLPLPLNEVSAEALTALPGIGPSKAAAIVADRELRGPFADLKALQRVRGIGPKTVEVLAPFLTVDSPPTPAER